MCSNLDNCLLYYKKGKLYIKDGKKNFFNIEITYKYTRKNWLSFKNLKYKMIAKPTKQEKKLKIFSPIYI